MCITARISALRLASEQHATSLKKKKKTTGCHSYVIQDLFWLSDKHAASETFPAQPVEKAKIFFYFFYLFVFFKNYTISRLILLMVSLQSSGAS